MDRNVVWRFPEGSGRLGRMETYCCNVICGAPTTFEVKGLRWDEMTITKSIPTNHHLPWRSSWKAILVQALGRVGSWIVALFQVSTALSNWFIFKYWNTWKAKKKFHELNKLSQGMYIKHGTWWTYTQKVVWHTWILPFSNTGVRILYHFTRFSLALPIVL